MTSEDDAFSQPRYPIRIAARRAGLTTATVRAWESRHGAIVPTRTDTARRLYSEADIERLQLLREVGQAGQSISDIASVSTKRLRKLAKRERTGDESTPQPPREKKTSVVRSLLRACDDAVIEMDAARLHALLQRGLVGLPTRVFMERVVVPLLHRVGRRWERGVISIAHEHAASAAIHQTLAWMLELFRLASNAEHLPNAPTIVFATPSGERHEFGVLMAAVLAASAGWRIAYLGADLPADQVATTARDAGAKAVAISLVALHDNPDMLEKDLRRLRRVIGPDVALLAGGAAAITHSTLLADIGAIHMRDLRQLSQWLAANSTTGSEAA